MKTQLNVILALAAFVVSSSASAQEDTHSPMTPENLCESSVPLVTYRYVQDALRARQAAAAAQGRSDHWLARLRELASGRRLTQSLAQSLLGMEGFRCTNNDQYVSDPKIATCEVEDGRLQTRITVIEGDRTTVWADTRSLTDSPGIRASVRRADSDFNDENTSPDSSTRTLSIAGSGAFVAIVDRSDDGSGLAQAVEEGYDRYLSSTIPQCTESSEFGHHAAELTRDLSNRLHAPQKAVSEGSVPANGRSIRTTDSDGATE